MVILVRGWSSRQPIKNILFLIVKPLIFLNMKVVFGCKKIHRRFVIPLLFARLNKDGKQSVLNAMHESRLFKRRPGNLEFANLYQCKDNVL